jgi:biotin-(acetyl-CoA carboxylase) ligase
LGIAYEPVAADATPTFPPLMSGRAVASGLDPFAKAVAAAALGEDAGAVFWSPDEDVLRAAVLFAPETPLRDALPMLFAAACAMNDAIGALAPPEVGLLHVWPDGIKINGAWCGAWRIDSDARDLDATPQWLAVGLSLSRRFPAGLAPGQAPQITALSEEGCADLSRVRLLESWTRHLLSWVHRWESDGPRPVFDAWLARAEGRGEEVAFLHDGVRRRGVFQGLSEAGDMVLRGADGASTLPVASVLDAPRVWPPALEPAR